MYPKRLILAVTTHGMLKCERENKLIEFTMPENIELAKLSISALGEVNVMDTWQAEDAIKMVSAYKTRLLSKKHNIDQLLHEIAVHLRKADAKFANEFLHKYNRELSKIIETYNSDTNSDSNFDINDTVYNRDDYAGYLHAFDRNYMVEHYVAGDTLLNKIYRRTNAEVPRGSNDWTVRAINMPGTPDIMNLLRIQTRHGDTVITLEQLIHELKAQGVEEIIMFDFSCSVVLTPSSEEYVRGRAKRALRRSTILKKGQYSSRKIQQRSKRNKKTQEKKSTE